MTLSPAKATPTSVLTVTVKLVNYPTVTFSQDITVIVRQPDPVAVQPIKIPNMILNATVNQEAFLNLPNFDAQYTYVVVSKQKFEASVDGNKLKVFSIHEADVGTYKLDLVADSSSDKVSFEVKVVLTLPTLIDTKTQGNAISKEIYTPTTTIETKKEESIMISDEET